MIEPHTGWSQSESSQESCMHEYERSDTASVTVCKLCGRGREEQVVFAGDMPFALSGPNEGRLIGENLRPDQNDLTRCNSYTYRKVQEIRRLCFQMNIPSHLTQGSENLYKNIRRRKYVRSALSTSLATYITCRNDEGNQLMFMDFLENLDLGRKQLSRPFFRIQKRDISYRYEQNGSNRICELRPTNTTSVMLERFYNELFPEDGGFEGRQNIIRDSEILYNRMEKNFIDKGRNPRGLYGTSLLLSSNLHGKATTIQEVSDVVGMSEATIRKRLSELKNTPGTDQNLEDYLNVPAEEWETNPLAPCMSSTIAIQTESASNTPDSISDTRYTIHGHHDSGDEISLCSEDELDVDNYLLSEGETARKTILWEEMFGDYTPPRSKRSQKTQFTPQDYHTIPEFFSPQSSHSSPPPSQEVETQRTPPKRRRRRIPPLTGNKKITDFFTSVTTSQESSSDVLSTVSESSLSQSREDDFTHLSSTPVQRFREKAPSHPYMTPPYSEDGDSLDFQLADNDPNFDFLRHSPTFEDPLNLQPK